MKGKISIYIDKSVESERLFIENVIAWTNSNLIRKKISDAKSKLNSYIQYFNEKYSIKEEEIISFEYSEKIIDAYKKEIIERIKTLKLYIQNLEVCHLRLLELENSKKYSFNINLKKYFFINFSKTFKTLEDEEDLNIKNFSLVPVHKVFNFLSIQYNGKFRRIKEYITRSNSKNGFSDPFQKQFIIQARFNRLSFC